MPGHRPAKAGDAVDAGGHVGRAGDDARAPAAAGGEAFGGERRAAVCRELTKTYEEVLRGTCAELAEWAGSVEVRGEISVVVAGAAEPAPSDTADLVADVQRRVEAGVRLKEAVAEVAATAGSSKRELYDAVLQARG